MVLSLVLSIFYELLLLLGIVELVTYRPHLLGTLGWTNFRRASILDLWHQLYRMFQQFKDITKILF